MQLSLYILMYKKNNKAVGLEDNKLQGYLRYRSIFCHKLALDAQFMNFFI